jgi:hypothetical protein
MIVRRSAQTRWFIIDAAVREQAGVPLFATPTRAMRQVGAVAQAHDFQAVTSGAVFPRAFLNGFGTFDRCNGSKESDR